MTGDASSIVFLVTVPLAAAVATTLLRGWVSAQRAIGIGALVANVSLSVALLVRLQPAGVLTSQLGAWPAPYGITIAFDTLSALMIITANIVALGCFLHAFASLRRRVEVRWFHPLFNLLMMGVNFSFITGDLFNLFVAFELMLMSSYALLCIGRSRDELTHAYKYVILNLIGSAFFVLGAGLVYGMLGTLNYADLARIVASGEPLPDGFQAVAVLLLIVFGLKAAVFPLWFWLPDTYPTCPVAVGALFSGLLTKVGVYAMCRLFPMAFAAPGVRDDGPVVFMLAIAAGVTMIVAIIAALGMHRIRRLLCLTLVSHMGFMIFGIAVMSPAALSGAVFYAVQHMIIMAALFLCCGLVERIGGSDDLRKLGGLQMRAPWLSALFLISGMSMVGLPPLSGFYGKLLIFREGFNTANGEWFWLLSVIGLLTSVLTLLAIAKVWAGAFWGPAPEPATRAQSTSEPPLGPAYAGAIITVALGLGAGFGAEGLLRLSNTAAAELNAPQSYVSAVLGEGAWSPGAASGEIADAGTLADEESRP